jgi:proteasome lid subunit RPN8/RPN11
MGEEVHVVTELPFRVTRAVIDRVSDHARTSYASDEEACGYLTGPDDVERFCDDAVPLANLANRYHALDPETYPRTGRTYFLIDPLQFAKAMQKSAEGGHPVRILYHSHLDVGAYFSETDAAAATMGGDQPSYEGLRYLVTSVRQGEVDDHKLFAWDDEKKAFVEAPLEVVTGK